MKVAIFGAGTMGSGIAQVFAAKGHTALMYASSVASAQRHKDKLAASLNKKVARGKMTQEAADDIMSRVLGEEVEAAADAPPPSWSRRSRPCPPRSARPPLWSTRLPALWSTRS